MNKSIALLAAGCFWGVQDYFDRAPGVVETEVGYTGGRTRYPSYKQVCSGQTGHAETVKVTFDPDGVSYRELLRHFFHVHDATQFNRQGPDIGSQYRSAIFYLDDEQRQVAMSVKEEIDQNSPAPIVTEIALAVEFYTAEDYHQNYTRKTGFGACQVNYQPQRT